MGETTRLDIAALWRRIKASAGAKAFPSQEKPGAASTGNPAGRHRPALLDADVRRNDLGTFLVRERFFADGRMNGDIAIAHLRAFQPSWLEGGSEARPPTRRPRRWAILDTETTGLAGGTGTCAFLVGVGAAEDDGFRVRQFFMRDFDEEAAMLRGLADHLRAFDGMVTYNGRTFDVPLLKTRYRLQRQPHPLDALAHEDLLFPARRIWSGRLPNCKLQTLESAVIGAERQGDVPGALIPRRYFDYLRTGKSEPLAPVFHHNVLDIVSLACLGCVLAEAYSAGDRAPLRHGEDLFGLARWLDKQGDSDQALKLYRRAVRAGLPPGTRFSSLWESARIERRNGNFEQQIQLLLDLTKVANMYRAAAFVELAKHYEHRVKDHGRALAMTHKAQRFTPSDELDHRERRLLRKIGRAQATMAAASAPATEAGGNRAAP